MVICGGSSCGGCPLSVMEAAGKKQNSGTIGSRKGIVLATIAGVLMSFFYRFVASAMDLNNFIFPTPGMATPYTAFFIFAVGIFFSNFIFNTLVMKHPFVGVSVTYKEYFAGKNRNTFGWYLRWMHLGAGNGFELYCC